MWNKFIKFASAMPAFSSCLAAWLREVGRRFWTYQHINYMNTEIQQRLESLREEMRRERVGAVIVGSSDPHGSEYVAPRWQERAWLSGFDGSAGTVVVTNGAAALWTDSRYFIAAAEQLGGTGIQLMRDGLPDTPTIAQWIGRELAQSELKEAAIDGSCLPKAEHDALQNELRACGGLTLRSNIDLVDRIWTGRPAMPHEPVIVHPLELAGETISSKIGRLRRELIRRHADGVLMTALDEIAWTLNLRGGDISCNPVFMAYLIVTSREAWLYTDAGRLSAEAVGQLDESGVRVYPYEKVGDGLLHYPDYSILIDPASASISLCRAAKGIETVLALSPVQMMKAVKNEAEIRGFRMAMERDGVAMVRFLMWLEKSIGSERISELSADAKLTELKRRQKGYRGKSFDTIMAYASHAAIVHYEADGQTDIELKPRGLLLLDHGTQYDCGTTDCTRTIPLGPLTDDERRVYTLVLKGHLALQDLKFPSGASGTQLDAIAREPLWREAMNFGHGTGHGVGACLCVHEGPHQIRQQWKPAPILAGMTVTDEPGLYLEGRFGVRIENTLLVREYRTSEFGAFLEFEPLTLCPVATAPIVRELLTEADLRRLNGYHEQVWRRLSPLLSEGEREWLRSATRPI